MDSKKIEELNTKINYLIEELEREEKGLIIIEIYSGDKIKGDTEYEGDKILLRWNNK